MIAQLVGLIIVLIVVIFSVFVSAKPERAVSRPRIPAATVEPPAPKSISKSTSKRVTFAPQRRERIIDANGKITERTRSV